MSGYYKVLVKHQSARGGKLTWSLPVQEGDDWRPGEWHTVAGEIVVCENGLHLTSDPTQWLKFGCEVYLAEGRGDRQAQGDETAFAEARLLRPAPEMVPNYWRDVERFVTQEIPSIPWCQPDGDPDPEWRLFTAPTLAAARDAARDAAWDAARAAAWDAAWDAARDVARAAAWDAAWAAAWDVARDAAWDAALYTQVQHVCGDLAIDQQHRDHVVARWEVWRKGYGLAGDVDGVLYVYAQEQPS